MNDVDVDDKFISPFKVRKKFDITSNTLRTWGEEGKIRFIRVRDGKGKRLYNIKDIDKIFGTSHSICPKENVICYARVSSDHQKEDLNRQIELLRKNFPQAEIISDIGSGLNFKRKGFTTLLERINSKVVTKVVVTYKDRLCRFGFELFEWFLKKSNTELMVLNSITDNEESQGNFRTSELAEDLLAITTVFVARNNGNRSAKFKKQRKEEKNQQQKQEEQDLEKKQK